MGTPSFLAGAYAPVLAQRDCYCTLHRCTHVVVRLDTATAGDAQCRCARKPALAVYWAKVAAVAALLETTRAGWLFYMDLDAVIQDLDTPATAFLDNAINSQRVRGAARGEAGWDAHLVLQDNLEGMPNAGLFFVRASAEGRALLSRWLAVAEKCDGGCFFVGDNGGLFDLLLSDLAATAGHAYRDDCLHVCSSLHFPSCGIALLRAWGQPFGARVHPHVVLYINDTAEAGAMRSFNRFEFSDTPAAERLSLETDFVDHVKAGRPRFAAFARALPEVMAQRCPRARPRVYVDARPECPPQSAAAGAGNPG